MNPPVNPRSHGLVLGAGFIGGSSADWGGQGHHKRGGQPDSQGHGPGSRSDLSGTFPGRFREPSGSLQGARSQGRLAGTLIG